MMGIGLLSYILWTWVFVGAFTALGLAVALELFCGTMLNGDELGKHYKMKYQYGMLSFSKKIIYFGLIALLAPVLYIGVFIGMLTCGIRSLFMAIRGGGK